MEVARKLTGFVGKGPWGWKSLWLLTLFCGKRLCHLYAVPSSWDSSQLCMAGWTNPESLWSSGKDGDTGQRPWVTNRKCWAACLGSLLLYLLPFTFRQPFFPGTMSSHHQGWEEEKNQYKMTLEWSKQKNSHENDCFSHSTCLTKQPQLTLENIHSISWTLHNHWALSSNCHLSVSWGPWWGAGVTPQPTAGPSPCRMGRQDAIPAPAEVAPWAGLSFGQADCIKRSLFPPLLSGLQTVLSNLLCFGLVCFYLFFFSPSYWMQGSMWDNFLWTQTAMCTHVGK